MPAVTLYLGEALRVLNTLNAESIDAERITRARQAHRLAALLTRLELMQQLCAISWRGEEDWLISGRGPVCGSC